MTDAPQDMPALGAAIDVLIAAVRRAAIEQAVEIARLREALVVVSQAKVMTDPAMNMQTIWSVTERARAALQAPP